MYTESAFNVVVFQEPGPSDENLPEDAQRLVRRHSLCDRDWGVGCLTYEPPAFDTLWEGLEQGDGLPVAYAVLFKLGRGAEWFIDRTDAFTYLWRGIEHEEWGKVMLLQVVPQPHLMASINVRMN